MEEHDRLQQQNQDLQRRVPETEKKNDNLTTRMSSLKETVGDIRLSNDKCQIDIKQLSTIIEDNSDSFIFNNDQMNGSTPSNSNEVKSFSSHTYIRKRIGRTVFNVSIIIINDMKCKNLLHFENTLLMN